MRDEPDIEALRIRLKEDRLGLTIERRGMLRVIASMRGWYSLEEFFEEARKSSAFHSKTTAYRNLPLFVRAGVVEESRLPNGRRRYRTIP